MRKVLVCGAGGFIGHHLVSRLKSHGDFVVGIDCKYPEYENTKADHFIIADLRDNSTFEEKLLYNFDEIYQLAADMGGAGYVFTGIHDSKIMLNSASININVLNFVRSSCKHARVFFSSSACIYPQKNQTDKDNPNCREDSAYPADPDSEYGWEKIFSERLYLASNRDSGVITRIGRYHNIFGEKGSWGNGKEKAPAAICRKVAEATDSNSTVEVWGDGLQSRSFLYIDDCIDATIKLMRSDVCVPLNIGSERLISINDLVGIVSGIAQKEINIAHVDGPQGVRGRVSDNELILKKIGWKPNVSLEQGLQKTYRWIERQVHDQIRDY